MGSMTPPGGGWRDDHLTVTTGVDDGLGGVAVGSFSVHRDQLPALKNNIEAARDKCIDVLQRAHRLGRITPPGNDPISQLAAQRISEQGGIHLAKCAQDGHDGFQRVIDQIDNVMRTYTRADEDSRM